MSMPEAVTMAPASPAWTVPLELVRFAASATARAFMYRAEARGAVFAPNARVFRRCDRLVAEIDFIRPIGPERQDGLAVMLSAPLQENAQGEGA